MTLSVLALLLGLAGVLRGQTITEFPIPTPSSNPNGITGAPDGNLWFPEGNGNQIGRITTAGVVTEFPIPTAASEPRGITAGPDANLWFTEFQGNRVGRITTAGAITEFPIPTVGSHPQGITAGPRLRPSSSNSSPKGSPAAAAEVTSAPTTSIFVARWRPSSRLRSASLSTDRSRIRERLGHPTRAPLSRLVRVVSDFGWRLRLAPSTALG